MQAGIAVVNPALKALQAVNQALRIGAEIRLARAELGHIDCREQHLVIQAVFRKLCEQFPDAAHESVLLLASQVLRRNPEIGFADAVCVAAVDIVPEALLNQSVVQNCARRF